MRNLKQVRSARTFALLSNNGRNYSTNDSLIMFHIWSSIAQLESDIDAVHECQSFQLDDNVGVIIVDGQVVLDNFEYISLIFARILFAALNQYWQEVFVTKNNNVIQEIIVQFPKLLLSLALEERLDEEITLILFKCVLHIEKPSIDIIKPKFSKGSKSLKEFILAIELFQDLMQQNLGFALDFGFLMMALTVIIVDEVKYFQLFALTVSKARGTEEIGYIFIKYFDKSKTETLKFLFDHFREEGFGLLEKKLKSDKQ